MYFIGRGVTQNYKEAFKWIKKSAQQGVPKAQYDLGFMYAYGQGTIQNHVLAHMYYNISAANGYKEAVNKRNLLAKEMTPSQIEKAQRLASEWVNSH